MAVELRRYSNGFYRQAQPGYIEIESELQQSPLPAE